MRVILETVIYVMKVTEPQISEITEFIGQYRRDWEYNTDTVHISLLIWC
jgi:hypothetical protein